MLRSLFFISILILFCFAGDLDPFNRVPDKAPSTRTRPGGGRSFPAFGANGLPGVQTAGGMAGQGQGGLQGFPGGQGGFQGGQGQGGLQGQGFPRLPGQGGIQGGQGGLQGFPGGQGQGGFQGGQGQGGLQGFPGGQGTKPGQGSLLNAIPILNTEVGYRHSNTCYIPYQRETCAPHFIIAGAMKTGTTSMFSYLLNHPNILPLKSDAQLNGRPILANKEIRFFNDPSYSQIVKTFGVTNAINQYFDVFPDIDKDWKIITGESSPMYICQKEVAARIKAALPYVKVIILLRDPIDRAYSEHWFKFSLAPQHKFDAERQHQLFEHCTRREINILKFCNVEQFLHTSVTNSLLGEFEQCFFQKLKSLRPTLPNDPSCQDGGANFGLCMPELSLPDNGVPYNCNELGIKVSLYALQLVEWVKLFDSDQLLILDSKEFFNDPASVMTQVIDFLGVDSDGFDWDFVDGKAYNIINPGQQGMYNLPNTLAIGQHTADSLKEKYPPINPDFRRELEQFFSPFNQLLAKTIKKQFWHY